MLGQTGKMHQIYVPVFQLISDNCFLYNMIKKPSIYHHVKYTTQICQEDFYWLYPSRGN